MNIYILTSMSCFSLHFIFPYNQSSLIILNFIYHYELIYYYEDISHRMKAGALTTNWWAILLMVKV